MIKDFNEIVLEYAKREQPVNIAVGLRPSGIIHLGNMATLGLSAILARNVGPHLSNVVLTVCDLDMPDASDWNIKEHQYVKYFRDLPSKTDPNETLLTQSMRGITNFVGGLESELGVKFHIQNLSDIQRNPKFREGLKKVLDADGVMETIHQKIQPGQAAVYPLCPRCKTSNPWFPTYKKDLGHLLTTCNNKECKAYGQPQAMNVLDVSRDLAVHFFIDPLRDKTVEPHMDVHVFGGDYAEEHGDGPVSKIEKIMDVTKIASEGKTPDILIGPTFYAKDGKKMSKSSRTGLQMDYLAQHFGDQYVKRVVHLLQSIVKDGLHHVDYAIVDKSLFGSKK